MTNLVLPRPADLLTNVSRRKLILSAIPPNRPREADVLGLYLPILLIMLLDAALLAALAWAFHAPRFAPHRISKMPSMRVSKAERIKTISTIAPLSGAVVFGGIWGLDRLGAFHAHAIPIWRGVLEALAIILVYDFAYYWLHRLMHVKRLMRFVHGVHHRSINPTAMESFYLHPAELVAGLLLLFSCTWLVGPVSTWSFAVVFFLHSTMNILVHSGLQYRHWLLVPIDSLTLKHHVHHNSDSAKNYSSLTPLPDLVFGTRG